jgi:uncharacterized protein (DUF1778 family)
MATNLASISPLTCRVLPAHLDLIDEAAKAARITRSAFIRRAVVAQAKAQLASSAQ